MADLDIVQSACDGRGGPDGHCCYVNGAVCEYLVENVDGRRFACGLLLTLGSWEVVHASAEWQALPFTAFPSGYGCGDWPQKIPGLMESGAGLCCFEETS